MLPDITRACFVHVPSMVSYSLSKCDFPRKCIEEHFGSLVHLDSFGVRVGLALTLFHSPSMIRFPPTSIGLSESDIDFHLREIQIKEHLYAQGFTRKEVQRYYNERHGNVNSFDLDDDVLSTRTSGINSSKPRLNAAHDSKSLVQTGEMRNHFGRSDGDLNGHSLLTLCRHCLKRNGIVQ